MIQKLSNKTWIISDTHFGHKKVIEYCSRPFSDIYEMEKEIIKNWNNRIKAGHDVYFLGDFSFYGKDRTTEICKSLNGNKIMIKGNHDSHSSVYYRDCGFEEVYKYPLILEGFWILSHEPLLMTEETPFFNIHGHIHNTLILPNSTTHYCVSVEQTNYKPLDFEKIRDEVMCRIERK